MKNNNAELSAYLKAMHSSGRLLVFRNVEELSFLKEWISGKYDSKRAVNPEPGSNTPGNYIQNCKLCGDVTNKKPGWGTGKNEIMIILNAPLNISKIEINKFKDESRELLSRMIGAINMELKESYITNLIKCAPGDSVNSPGMMLKNCLPILTQEITEYNPKIIIVMGDDTPVKRIMNQHKKILWYKIDHPINIIKNPELKKPAWITLKKLIADLNNINKTDL